MTSRHPNLRTLATNPRYTLHMVTCSVNICHSSPDPAHPDSCPAPPAEGGKEKRSVLRSLVTSLKQSRDADTETADTGPELERMTSKNSRRSRRRVDSRYCGFRYIYL